MRASRDFQSTVSTLGPLKYRGTLWCVSFLLAEGAKDLGHLLRLPAWLLQCICERCGQALGSGTCGRTLAVDCGFSGEC